jgi:hypothetical protein
MVAAFVVGPPVRYLLSPVDYRVKVKLEHSSGGARLVPRS